MKYLVSVLSLSALLGNTFGQSLSPTVISSSGAFYSNGSAMLSTTIGEMTMVETFSTAGNFLTQGFQQPEDFNVGIAEPKPGINEILVYPNPASDILNLQTNFHAAGSYLATISNVIGQTVSNSVSGKTRGMPMNHAINIKQLVNGIYFIKVDFTSDTQQKKSFTQKITVVK
jgi:hypothetical protein